MNMNGAVCLVTGCGSGIGKHLMGALVRRGAKVLATDIDVDAVRAEVEARAWPPDWVHVMPLDVRDPAQWPAAVDATIARWGRIDYLFNVAGIVRAGAIHEAEIAAIDLHIDVNLKGLIYGCRFAGAQMVQQRQGHIINIASLAALVPLPGMSLYNASKFGVRGFSHSIAEDLIPHGVFVSVVCPDAVATPMLDQEALEPDSAIAFSGSTILTVEDVERVIFDKVLPAKPREVLMAGWLAFLIRLTTAWPAVVRALIPFFRDKGLKNQRRYRDSHKPGA